MSSSVMSSRIDTTSAAAHPRPLSAFVPTYDHDELCTSVGSFIDDGSRPALLPFRGQQHKSLSHTKPADSLHRAADDPHQPTPRSTCIRPIPAPLLKKLFAATAQEEKLAREAARRREDEAMMQHPLGVITQSHDEVPSIASHKTEQRPMNLHMPAPPPARSPRQAALRDLREVLPRASAAAPKPVSLHHQDEVPRATSSQKERTGTKASPAGKEQERAGRDPSPPPAKSSLPPETSEQAKMGSIHSRSCATQGSTKTIRVRGKNGLEARVEVPAVIPPSSRRTWQHEEHVNPDSSRGGSHASHAASPTEVGRTQSHRTSVVAQTMASTPKAMSNKSRDGSIGANSLPDTGKAVSAVTTERGSAVKPRTSSSGHLKAASALVIAPVAPDPSITATHKSSRSLSSASTSMRSKTSKRTASTGAHQAYVESVSTAASLSSDHAAKAASKVSARTTTTTSIHHFSDTGMQWTQTATREGSRLHANRASIIASDKAPRPRDESAAKSATGDLHTMYHEVPVRPPASEPPSIRSAVHILCGHEASSLSSLSTVRRARLFQDALASQHTGSHTIQGSERFPNAGWPSSHTQAAQGEHSTSRSRSPIPESGKGEEMIASLRLVRSPDSAVMVRRATFEWPSQDRERIYEHSLASSYASRQHPAYTATSHPESLGSARRRGDADSIISISAPRSVLSECDSRLSTGESISPNDSASQIPHQRDRRRPRDRDARDDLRLRSPGAPRSASSAQDGPTIFAGKGWISPHPLSVAPTSVASPPQSAIRIPCSSEHASAGDGVMFYDEWVRMQKRGLAAEAKQIAERGHRDISDLSSDRTAAQRSPSQRSNAKSLKREDGDSWQEVGQGVTNAGSAVQCPPPTVQSTNGGSRRTTSIRSSQHRQRPELPISSIAASEHRRNSQSVMIGTAGSQTERVQSDRASWRAERTPSMAEEW